MKKRLDEKIEDAKKFIKENYNNKYEFVDAYYKNTKSKRRKNGRNEFFIKLKCNTCNEVFERRYCAFKTNDRCFYCVTYTQNSFLHNQISLMAKRYYDNVKTEKDIGFKGLKGKPSKYDLYIPNHYEFGNVLIEFQSRFHDNKRGFDAKKKQYALESGFNFMEFDERDYNIDDVSLILFGKVVDEDIKNNFLKRPIDFDEVQKLLDKNMTYKAIGEKLKISPNIIQNHVNRGRLYLRKDRMNYTHNKTPLIRIDAQGNITEVDSAWGYFKSTSDKIPRPKQGSMIFSRGYFWVRKNDYINNNYKEHRRFKKFNNK